MTGKPWYTSKTEWINIAALVGSVALVLGVDLTGSQFGQLTTVALAAANIVLRVYTGEPITLSKKDLRPTDGDV